jgi:hypothetical protein
LTGVDLTRRRELGQLVEDSWSLYGGNLGLFLTIALAIVIPTDLLVLGVGAGQLWQGYEDDPNLGPSALAAVLHLLVIQPLVTAACIAAVMSLGRAEVPTAGWSIARGFERWGAVLAAVLLAGLATLGGFIFFIIPGIWLAVALYFASQAVVAEGALTDRGVAPQPRARPGAVVARLRDRSPLHGGRRRPLRPDLGRRPGHRRRRGPTGVRPARHDGRRCPDGGFHRCREHAGLLRPARAQRGRPAAAPLGAGGMGGPYACSGSRFRAHELMQ